MNLKARNSKNGGEFNRVVSKGCLRLEIQVTITNEGKDKDVFNSILKYRNYLTKP